MFFAQSQCTRWLYLSLIALTLLAVGSKVQATLAQPPLQELLRIGQIQGDGRASPRLNQRVSLRGIVTGAYQDRNAAGVVYYTLFVQDLADQADGDPATSDGIAVFLGRRQPTAAIGDRVVITGTVTEFFGLTEIDDNDLAVIVESSGNIVPEPVDVKPPADNEDAAEYFEPFEGMRVTIAGEAVAVGPTYVNCAFPVIRADSGLTRVVRESLDDPVGQVITVLHRTDVDCTGFPLVRTGDRITGIVGPLIYNFDRFKIVQQEPAALVVTSEALRPPPPPLPVGEGQVAIASFNVLNYFDTIDHTGDDSEPKPTQAELESKQTKLVYTIGETLGCPAVLGLQEVENKLLLDELAAKLELTCGFTYDVSHRESADSRGIDVALLTQPGRVEVTGIRQHQSCTLLTTEIDDPQVDCPAGQDALFGRQPLQVNSVIDERPVSFIVNHFKSKSGGEEETELERLAQGESVNMLIGEMLAQNSNAAVVVLGDFNDYLQSGMMAKLTAEGRLIHALASLPKEERYSYIFDGASQLIDGILVTPVLADRVVMSTVLHVNADYSYVWHEAASGEGLPYYVSDHDIPLLVLQTGEMQTPPTPTATPTAGPPTATPAPPGGTTDSTEQDGFGQLLFVGVIVVVVGVFLLWRRGGR